MIGKKLSPIVAIKTLLRWIRLFLQILIQNMVNLRLDQGSGSD